MEQTVESATRYQSAVTEPSAANEARASGVSWAAVIGGAFVAAALSLILLALGAGLGFSSFSIWANVGVPIPIIILIAGRLEETQAHYHEAQDRYRKLLEEQPNGTPHDPNGAVALAPSRDRGARRIHPCSPSVHGSNY